MVQLRGEVARMEAEKAKGMEALQVRDTRPLSRGCGLRGAAGAGRELEQRFSRLTSRRRAAAHPDVGLLSDLRGAIGGLAGVSLEESAGCLGTRLAVRGGEAARAGQAARAGRQPGHGNQKAAAAAGSTNILLQSGGARASARKLMSMSSLTLQRQQQVAAARLRALSAETFCGKCKI